MSKHDSFFCNNCREKTLHIKKTPNHILHLLLSIFTAGLWLIVWFLVVVSSAGASWRCSKCGTSITGIALAETKSDTKDCPMCAETIKAAAQICRFCGHIFEPAVVKEEIKEFRETPNETKKTSKFSPVLVVLVLGLGIIGLIKLLDMRLNYDLKKTIATTSSQIKNQSIITQKKNIISPTQTKKRPLINEKKILKTDNFFGNFTNPIIKKESGTVLLKVWQPYIDYMRTLPTLFQVLLKEPFQLRVEYDEIWVDEYDEPFTEQEKREYKGQLDMNTLYWKNDKIQAYKGEKHYESNPKTKSPVNAHKIFSIYDRASILKEHNK